MIARRRLVRGVAAGLAVVILLGVLWHYWHALRGLAGFNRAEFVALFRRLGPSASVWLALVLAVVSMIPGAPNSVIAVLNGVCLGAPLGFVVNVAGLSVGNMIGARLVDRVELRYQNKRRSRLLDDLMKARHRRLGVLLGYAVPFIPNTLVHLASAELQLPRRQVDALILAGSLPTAFFYAFGGDAALRLRPGRLLIAVAVIAASAGVITLIRRDRRQQNEASR